MWPQIPLWVLWYACEYLYRFYLRQRDALYLHTVTLRSVQLTIRPTKEKSSNGKKHNRIIGAEVRLE